MGWYSRSAYLARRSTISSSAIENSHLTYRTRRRRVCVRWVFVLEGIACVDFDVLDMDLGWHFLPPTWKERSPRGYHLFYRIPPERGPSKMAPKIKWRPDVDLLIKGQVSARAPRAYGGGANHKTDTPFFGHVLVSPSDGYKRIWPDAGVPERDKLTTAPEWLCEALLKK